MDLAQPVLHCSTWNNVAHPSTFPILYIIFIHVKIVPPSSTCN